LVRPGLLKCGAVREPYRRPAAIAPRDVIDATWPSRHISNERLANRSRWVKL
jgi:hypothetical protein